MAIPLPAHPNVRKCTHIKVTGQQCGSPALRGEFFCYFHTRVIKGVQQRVDMQLDSMALLEDCEAIQFSIMHVVDGLVKGTLDATRARLIVQALRIAARNAKNVPFDNCCYAQDEQKMVRQVPNYARQYLIEHPEIGPPLDSKNKDSKNKNTCTVHIPVREPEATAPQREAQAPTAEPQQDVSEASPTAEPAAQRGENAAHCASPGVTIEDGPAPTERKKPERDTQERDTQEEENELKRVLAAIAGAERGNWRDLRTVFEFAGITERSKEAPS